MKVQVTHTIEYELPPQNRAQELWAEWRAEYGRLAAEITAILAAAGRSQEKAAWWAVSTGWNDGEDTLGLQDDGELWIFLDRRVYSYQHALRPNQHFNRGAVIREAIRELRRAVEVLRSAAAADVLGCVLTQAYDFAILRGGKWTLTDG